jgi:microcystin-dependent protein
MKKSVFLFIVFCMSISLFAQNGISFQGIARDPSGNAIPNQTVTVKFTIGSFVETQSIATDNFGIFSATIGSVNSADFGNLVFANISDNLKVEVDGTIIYDDKFNTVPYAKASDNGVPPGTIVPFAGPKNKIPAGWLYCNGTSYATTGMYAKLYAAIGLAWGSDGGNFRVPDLRGYFLRGMADGTALDPDKASRTAKYSGGSTGDNVGSYQRDSIQSHTHTGSANSAGNHSHTFGTRGFQTDGSPGADGSHDDDAHNTDAAGAHTHTLAIANTGGVETRPENAGVIFIIKY